MNVITIEDYKSTYWPKLDGAIDQLLTQSPGDYIPISYEQIYRWVRVSFAGVEGVSGFMAVWITAACVRMVCNTEAVCVSHTCGLEVRFTLSASEWVSQSRQS